MSSVVRWVCETMTMQHSPAVAIYNSLSKESYGSKLDLFFSQPSHLVYHILPACLSFLRPAGMCKCSRPVQQACTCLQYSSISKWRLYNRLVTGNANVKVVPADCRNIAPVQSSLISKTTVDLNTKALCVKFGFAYLDVCCKISAICYMQTN